MNTVPAGDGRPDEGFNWWGYLAFGLIVAFVGGAGFWAWDTLGPGGGGPLARVEDFEPGVVRYFSDDRLYLVRLESGEFVAFDDRDTAPGARGRECAVAWRPELEVEGEAGVFQGRCTGNVWNARGSLLSGPGPDDLVRLAVQIDDDGGITAEP